MSLGPGPRARQLLRFVSVFKINSNNDLTQFITAECTADTKLFPSKDASPFLSGDTRASVTGSVMCSPGYKQTSPTAVSMELSFPLQLRTAEPRVRVFPGLPVLVHGGFAHTASVCLPKTLLRDHLPIPLPSPPATSVLPVARSALLDCSGCCCDCFACFTL